MRHLDEIILHTTATTVGWMKQAPAVEKVKEIRRWHVEGRGWSDIGYHYLSDRDGAIAQGRPLERIGAHVQGHNEGTIGIALVGGYGGKASDNFLDNYTTEQDEAVRKLIAKLKRAYPSITKVSGHNQYANKECPCFYVPDWYAEAQVNIPEATPTEGKSTDWYRWRLAELRDLAQKALEDGNKP